MDNPFDILAADIMTNLDITEEVVVAGRSVRVGVSSLDFSPTVTDWGMDSGVTFFLTMRSADAETLKRGDIIVYKGVKYKCERKVVDSAGRLVTVYLGSLTRR